MEDRLFQALTTSTPKVSLPSPVLLMTQQQENSLLSARIIETLDLILRKQADLEKRTRDITQEIQAFKQRRDLGMKDQRIASSALLMSLLVSPRSRPLYELELAEPLVTPFCKGKYFELKVRLKSPEVHPNTVLEVLLYTSDVPPRKIVHNMTGRQMLRGVQQTTLAYTEGSDVSLATFKIQLNEVTSHFCNGWIFLVVQPIASSTRGDIRPMVLDNIVIKAKESTCQRWRSRSRDC
jgi:hypothetical protein